MEAREDRCKLCGARTRHAFSAPLTGGMEGRYYQCSECGLLQSWHLDDLSGEELAGLYRGGGGDCLDAGEAWRQFNVTGRLLQLSRLGVLPGTDRRFKVLDYGCGSGFVGSCLAMRFGWQVTLFDPYAPPRFAAARRVSGHEEALEGGPYGLIVATEVFEHFLEPRRELEGLGRLLSDDGGLLYATTGLYVPGRSGPDWSYLAPASGRHATFFSRGAIRRAAALMGASGVYRAGAEYEWLFAKRGARFSPVREARLRLASLILTRGVKRGLLGRIE